MLSIKSICPFSIIYDVPLCSKHTPITMQLQPIWLEPAPNATRNMKEKKAESCTVAGFSCLFVF